MKISELPEEVRLKALVYQKEASSRLDKNTDILSDAFQWAFTKEGFAYWEKLDEAISTNNSIINTTDKIVLSVMNDLNERSKVGIKKYGVTMERNDLTRKEWLQHAYEECLDQANYLKKLITLEK